MTMNQFQPTLPARGATLRSINRATVELISTHAPRTGSDAGSHRPRRKPHPISTHAPRTGSDRLPCKTAWFLCISTHAPRTGSDDVGPQSDAPFISISTHAPRTGSDATDVGRTG